MFLYRMYVLTGFLALKVKFWKDVFLGFREFREAFKMHLCFAVNACRADRAAGYGGRVAVAEESCDS